MVRAISATNKQQVTVVPAEKPPPRNPRDAIIDIIDSVLEPGEAGAEFNYSGYSSESIDRLGEEDRRPSAGSVTLSLVFDMQRERPVFRKIENIKCKY